MFNIVSFTYFKLQKWVGISAVIKMKLADVWQHFVPYCTNLYKVNIIKIRTQDLFFYITKCFPSSISTINELIYFVTNVLF